MDCIFCKIVKGEIPSKKILETGKSLAFLDAFPVTAGHCLVIPRNHYEKIQDIPSEENKDLFETVRMVTSKIDQLTGATLIAIHNGKQSGQEVPHVHVHLIPRSKNDSAGPVHSMFKNTPKPSNETTEEIFKKLII